MASITKRTWKSTAGSGKKKAGGRRAGESWQVAYTEADGRRVKKAGFRTRADAERFALEKETEIAAGTSRPAGDKVKVAELGVRIIASMQERVDRDTVVIEYLRNVKGHFRNYIAREPDWKPHSMGGAVRDFQGSIGHIRLTKLRPTMVEDFRDALLASGLNYQTVRAILTTLHSALEYARRKELVTFNAADRIIIEVPRSERNLRRPPPLPQASVTRAFGLVPGNVRFLLQFVASTGLRTGELRALRYRHIDREAKTVMVECSANTKNIIGPPKSSAGYREIPLSDELLSRLQAYRTEYGSDDDDAFLMANPTGQMCHGGWLLKQLYKVFDAAGWIGLKEKAAAPSDARRFNIHELRHYAISSWIAADLGLKAVQTYAGHADIKMTWNRYGHLFPDDRRAEKMNVAARRIFCPA